MKALLAVALLGGCIPTTSFDGDPDSPVNDEPHPTVNADGTYELRSQIDVTVDAVLPQTAYEVVETLDRFSTAPAHTLLDLCEQAGVPAIGELGDALPSFLESRLEGLIDDQIEKLTFAGRPVTQIAAEIAALGETTLTEVSLDSELVIAGGNATHRLTRVGVAGVTVDLAAGPDDILVQATTIRTSGATVTIGDHAYSIPYGRYAWQALEAAVEAEYGAPPRALLGAAVNCPAVAHEVATTCVFGACIGHEDQLTTLCERGLDEIVDRARTKLESIRFDVLHFASGTASVVDARQYSVSAMTAEAKPAGIERLTDGTWTAELNASQGLRPVPATFASK